MFLFCTRKGMPRQHHLVVQAALELHFSRRRPQRPETLPLRPLRRPAEDLPDVLHRERERERERREREERGREERERGERERDRETERQRDRETEREKERQRERERKR